MCNGLGNLYGLAMHCGVQKPPLFPFALPAVGDGFAILG